MSDSDTTEGFKNKLVAGFGTATADEPPYPAQEHLDCTDGDKIGNVETRVEPNVTAGKAHGVNPESQGNQNPADPDPDADSQADAHGNIAEVLAWVGDDKDKAQRALDSENAKSDARSTLVADLEKIAGA